MSADVRKILCIFLIFWANKLQAQTVPVGTAGTEDQYRRSQLFGKLDSSLSFTIRPIYPTAYKQANAIFFPDDAENRKDVENYYVSKNGKLEANLLPVSLQTQINTHHPYGWNDGGMIPAKGFQSVISAGFFAKYGLLTVQFRPEFINAVNPYFETFDKRHYQVIFARYNDIYNNVDLPARFGSQAYTRAYWGQSSIRLNWRALSFGISTENLWWGPGIRNSLLLSNTSPGFKHLTLNTVKPVKTAIGSFEGQIIAGRLENSGFSPLTPDTNFLGVPLYVPKPNDWRFLSGIILTWQPKWLPGLFLGYSQASQSYGKDLHGVKYYLPLFSSIKLVNADDEPINKSDRVNSLFMRWLWPAEHAEAYFEYGHYNTNGSLRQSILNPDESRGYTFGLRKLVPINKLKDEGVMIAIEATQLQETSIEKIQEGYSWYVSKSIRQGYTNRGETLGAGIGPGSNLQSLDIAWVKGLKTIGLQLERYLHNNDFYYYAFSDSYDFRRHWTDLSLGVHGEWDYKKFIFNYRFQGIKSINYQWYLQQDPGDEYFVNGRNAFNVHIQLGAMYRF